MKDLSRPSSLRHKISGRLLRLGSLAFAIALMTGTLRAQLPNPVCYIPFDEGTGSIAHDVVGTHNATLMGGAGWTPGIVGAYGLSLPGTVNSYADIPSDVVDTTQSFTVCAWVNLNTTAGYQTFVSEDSGYQSAFFLQKRGGFRYFHVYHANWRCDRPRDRALCRLRDRTGHRYLVSRRWGVRCQRSIPFRLCEWRAGWPSIQRF